jgi:competence protein ComEA
MPDLTRSQLLVYGAVAAALLLIGARWIRAGSDENAGAATFASASARPGDPGTFAVSQGGEDVVIHVAGAVESPGVYRLPAGSRVTDAVDRAGGPTRDAEVDAVNLAARLGDGQQIIIPARAVGSGGVSEGTAAATAEGPISLGSATLEQLDTIEGIGPVTAQNILDYRDQHGGVSSIDQLDEISGIGPATLEALRARLQP